MIAQRHCSVREVNAIRDRLRKEGITDGAVSDALGCSRTQWNQMLNGHQPMRRVYRYAVIGYLIMRKTNRNQHLREV